MTKSLVFIYNNILNNRLIMLLLNNLCIKNIARFEIFIFCLHSESNKRITCLSIVGLAGHCPSLAPSFTLDIWLRASLAPTHGNY